MDERACPSVDEIRDFLNERLVPARDQELSLHIQDCQSCSELMTTVVDSDETQDHGDLLPVLAEIRTVQKDQSFEAEDACLQAVERARQIPERSSSSAPGSEVNDIAERVSPPSMLGPYELGAEIGTGGMGSVYRATHSKLGRTVAVKILHGRRMSQPDAIARFEREMKAVGQLEHPNIVRATDADEDDGVQYLVMEYLDGVDLSSLVRQRGPLPAADACELVRQAANGLQHAHENGFVHRDVKPANLMLCATQNGGANDTECRATVAPHSVRKAPCVKILDLGLALLDEATDDALTSTGQVMGTTDYMAPETLDWTSQIDIRADIYSLGATLCKLLTGRAPYDDGKPRSQMQKLKALATREPTPISNHRSDLSKELVDIIGRMLACSPNDRYATPHEVAEALLDHTVGNDLAALLDSADADQAGANQSVASVVHRPPEPAKPATRAGGFLGAAIAAFAIVVLVVVIQRNSASTPSNPKVPSPEVAKSNSIRLEDRTLIFEDRDDSAIDITVRTEGPRLVLHREVGVFDASLGEGDGTTTFSIDTSEFEAFRMQLGQGDDQLTLEDISGINGDVLIDSGKGDDRIEVRGVIELGESSLTVNVARIFTFAKSQISAVGNGSIRLNAIVQSASEPGAAILVNGNSSINTEHGDITLSGDASSHAELPINGVFLESSSIATESGAVMLRGRASTGVDEHKYWGVAINYNASVSSTGTGAGVGRISIDGVGGVGGGHNQGIHILQSAIHSHTAEIYLSGHGGSGLNRNDGIRMETSTIASHDGSIRISGTGGSGGTDGDSCLGVAIIVDAHVRTTGQGHILIDGVGGRDGRAGAENHIGVDFGSSRSTGLMATIRSANGNVTLKGRGGSGASRGVVFGGDVISDEGTVSIQGEGAGGAADVQWTDGVIGDDTSNGDIKLIADSLNITGGAMVTSGQVVVQTRTDEMALHLTDEPNANYIAANGLSAFSSRIGSLTIHDQRGHDWRRRSFDGQLQWFQLINGIETKPLTVEPSFSVSPAADAPPLAVAPFTTADAKEHQKAWADHLGSSVERVNSLGMRLRLMPPGEFLMGAPDDDSNAGDNEKPQHRVRLTRPFWMCETEVTTQQFAVFVADTDYVTEAETDGGGAYLIGKQARDSTLIWNRYNDNPSFLEYPVRNVSWTDATEFCEWLSKKEGRTYRLPTDAEWEYACRAGTTSRYSFGEDFDPDLASAKITSSVDLRRVAQFPANPFGLYDMHGNADEMCLDGRRDYTTESAINPVGPLDESLSPVVRGGSVTSWTGAVSSSARNCGHSRLSPGKFFATAVKSFRVVMLPDDR